MMVTNNVTGAASLFRRELLEVALPFPPGGTGQELYHDHWLALCALAQGPLAYVDRPTHDYTRHDASVTLTEADGHWVAPPQDRLDAARMRARRLRPPAPPRLAQPRLALRLHRPLPADPPARHDPAAPDRPRADRGAAPPRHRSPARRRALPRCGRSGSSRRSFRPWIGRNDTLARERVIFGGILWRKLAVAASRTRGASLEVRRADLGRDRACSPSSSQSAGSPRLADLIDLEAEHRALHPRRRDVDPEQVEDGLLRHPQELLAGHARRARRSAARWRRSRSRSPGPRRRPR